MSKISVVVTSYNPSWEKLFATLQSIASQRNVDFDVVIADDGSQRNYFEDIERYFDSISFKNYVLTAQEQNAGIVKNFLNGVRHAKGAYIKGLGVGDLLFAPDSLKTLLDRMMESHAEVCITNYSAYSRENGIIQEKSIRRFPQNTRVFENAKQLKKHYLLWGDRASGCCTAFLRDTLLRYLEMIDGRVIFAEDMILRMMVFDECKFISIPSVISWYEVGSGVSTSGSSIWGDRLEQDWETVTKMLMERCKDCDDKAFAAKYVRRSNAHLEFRQDMSFSKHLRYYLSNLGILFFRLKVQAAPKMTPCTKDTAFLNSCYRA